MALTDGLLSFELLVQICDNPHLVSHEILQICLIFQYKVPPELPCGDVLVTKRPKKQC